MTVVDASVWVALLLVDDEFHHPSSRWLDRAIAAGERFEAPSLLLPEVVGSLSRRTTRVVSVANLMSQLSDLRVELRPVGIDLAALAAEIASDRGRIAGADAVYVALAEALDVPLVTWDRRQADAAGARAIAPEG